MAKERILVVDDEESLCEILKFNLELDGYEVDTVSSAEGALRLDLSSYSLILLDVMMGQMSGFEMAKILKQRPGYESIPIIFCSAKDTEDDTIKGFNLGADDYISKPFSVREVSARVKSVLRRSSGVAKKSEDEVLNYGSLHINFKKKSCELGGVPVSLTKKEFEILSLLLQNRGVIFSREDILHRIWSADVVVLDRTIDVNITRLRKKIGEYGQNIVTRLGYGYGFEE